MSRYDSTNLPVKARQEADWSQANTEDVDAHARLVERVAAEQDDVLCTLQLVQTDVSLSDRLFDQLVDLLVEGMFLELRGAHLDGNVDRETYVSELGALAERCRSVGLLPLPSHGT